MNKRLVAVLVAVFVVAGCSRSEKTDGAAGTQAMARAPIAPGADAVAAALQSPGTPIAKLGFVVTSRPVVGAQSGLRLDISGAAPGTLLVTTEGDGVEIDPAMARVGLAVTTADATVSHALQFTPQRDGILEVTVRLHGGAADSPETIYVIPVLVAKAAVGG
ncbi:MAG: hypothetical protein ABIQ86_09210 [Steroidobacteraceae bacterium]